MLHCALRILPRTLAAAALATAALAAPAHAGDPGVLRVCADPDNLPHSHRDGSGFENRIAALLADELGARLEVAWAPLQGRIVASTLGARRCDVLLGVPAGFARAATTRPYYRSPFVFVQRAGTPPIASFDDPRLARARIAVPRVRHDNTATPPAYVLERRGAGARLAGHPVESGDAAARIVEAVGRGEADVGVLWGPQAAWFAARAPVPLQLVPVPPAPPEHAALPMQVPMALAVRSGDGVLLEALERALERRREQIDAVLAEFGVPRSERP